VSTHKDGFVVKQDGQVIAKRRNGCAALVEFASKLEQGLAGLRVNICDIVPRRCIELNSNDEDDDAGRKLRDVIVDVADALIEVAFSKITWPLRRDLQSLRRALRW
jgi:hypothetical protein